MLSWKEFGPGNKMWVSLSEEILPILVTAK